MATLGKDSDREVCRTFASDNADRSAMDLLKAAAQGDEGLVSTLMKQGADHLYQAGNTAFTGLDMHDLAACVMHIGSIASHPACKHTYHWRWPRYWQLHSVVHCTGYAQTCALPYRMKKGAMH